MATGKAPTAPGKPAPGPAAPKAVSGPAATPARTDAPVAEGKKGKKKKEKKAKVEKIEYRFDTSIFTAPEGVTDWNGGDKLKSSTAPSNYDASKHKPLRRSDFENEYDFYEFKATQHEKEAVECRKLAQEARTVGATGDKKKGKRVVALTNQLQNLLKELSSDGQTDINSLGLPPEMIAAFTKAAAEQKTAE